MVRVHVPTRRGSRVERESLLQVLAYLVRGFGIGEDGGIHGLEEHRLVVVVATLEQALPASRK